jgi:hypothetical protein
MVASAAGQLCQAAEMRATLKRALGLGLLAGAVYAIWRALETRRDAADVTWTPQPFPSPPMPVPRSVPAAGDAPDAAGDWLAPTDGTCPASHPVKAKLASGIYHVPGGLSYKRTRPDRCYADPASAEADGLRAARR